MTVIMDHNKEAFEKLPTQFVDKPILKALIETWMKTSQELEQDFYDIETKSYFKVAEGKQLDRYGSLLSSPRVTGSPDESFRFQLVEQIMKRSSDGTPDRIREVLEATTVITDTNIFEHFIGAIFIYGVVPVDFDLSLVERAEIADIVKAGAPVTTSATVLGVTKDQSSLWIPSELVTELSLVKLVDTPPAGAGDTDVLATQPSGDFIAVKIPQFVSFIDSENGKLAEKGIPTETFVIESPTEEDLVVSPEGDVFEINISSSSFPFFSNHGIPLEINQFVLGDTI